MVSRSDGAAIASLSTLYSSLWEKKRKTAEHDEHAALDMLGAGSPSCLLNGNIIGRGIVGDMMSGPLLPSALPSLQGLAISDTAFPTPLLRTAFHGISSTQTSDPSIVCVKRC